MRTEDHGRRDDGKLRALLKSAAKKFAAMSPSEQEAALRKQREGYVAAELSWPLDCALSIKNGAPAPAREIWVAERGFDFEIFTVVNSSGVSIACLVDGVSSAAGLPRLSSEEARQLAAMLEKSATKLDNLPKEKA